MRKTIEGKEALLYTGQWKESVNDFGARSHLYYIGRWKCAGVFRSMFCGNRIDEKFAASCVLPGIKKDLWAFPTEEDAKARVERAVDHWFKRLHEEIVDKDESDN